MTAYIVTVGNWNDPLFWQSVDETSTGHTLDFSGLGAAFDVVTDQTTGIITISDGSTVFTVGEAGAAGTDANLGGTTDLGFFDNVIGSGGSDNLNGSAGNETITGGFGDDTISAGDGDDVITGDVRDDAPVSVINGDFSNAETGWTIGGAGSNFVYSGALGFNAIESSAGGTASQTITTVIGDNYELQFDAMELGSGVGDHTLVVDVLDENGIVIATDTIVLTDGDSGVFTLQFAATTASSTLRFTNSESTATFETDLMIDNISVTNVSSFGLGKDSIDGGDGDDFIDAGAGNDTLIAGLGSDTLLGGDGNDLLIRSGTDVNDTLNVLSGGAGDDTIRLEDGLNVNDQVDGGDGIDTLEILPGDDRNLTVDMENGQVADGAIGTQEFVNIENITTGGGDDTIIGNDADNVLDGGEGNDSIFGGVGDDVVLGGAGNDTLSGAQSPTDPVTVVNSGFDSGSTGWTTTGSGTFVYDADGEDVMALNANDETTGGTVEQTVTTQAGRDYELTFDAAEHDFFGASGDHTLVVEVVDSNGVVIATQTQVIADESSQTITLPFTSTTDNVTLRFSNPTSTATTDTDLTIDNIAVTPVDPVGSDDDVLIGGAGDDVLEGGAGADTFVLADGSGNDVVTDFDLTDSGDGTTVDQLSVLAMTDADGNPVDAWDVVVTDTNGDGTGDAILTFPNGESVTLVGVTPDQVDTAEELNAIGVPCFTPGTLIAAEHGERPVEDIRPGDLVWTADNGLQPVRWVGRRTLTQTDLAERENLRPVVIRKNAFGNRRRMVVSPQHAMVTSLGGKEHLIRAKHAAERFGGKIARVDKRCERVTYVHIMFDKHELIYAEGALTEAFYPGPVALGSIDKAALAELLTLFPSLANVAFAGKAVASVFGSPARRYLRRKDISSIELHGNSGPDLAPSSEGTPVWSKSA
ncbi:MAG: Hint domain-containing protein [Roseovarius sp.]